MLGRFWGFGVGPWEGGGLCTTLLICANLDAPPRTPTVARLHVQLRRVARARPLASEGPLHLADAVLAPLHSHDA